MSTAQPPNDIRTAEETRRDDANLLSAAESMLRLARIVRPETAIFLGAAARALKEEAERQSLTTEG